MFFLFAFSDKVANFSAVLILNLLTQNKITYLLEMLKIISGINSNCLQYVIDCYYLKKIERIKIQVSQKWRTNYLLPYPGCLNVHEKNMEKIFQTKK
jgi:hypothetical protein